MEWLRAIHWPLGRRSEIETNMLYEKITNHFMHM